MEKLADGLQKLTEDDLLNVVQLIHELKTADTYTKNDVESTYSPPACLIPAARLQAHISTAFMLTLSFTDGEFHVDLYTLPDGLVKQLVDLCVDKGVY